MIGRIRDWIRARRRRFDREFDEEWNDHLARIVAELEAQGVPRDEAIDRAVRRLGDRETARRATYDELSTMNGGWDMTSRHSLTVISILVLATALVSTVRRVDRLAREQVEWIERIGGVEVPPAPIARAALVPFWDDAAASVDRVTELNREGRWLEAIEVGAVRFADPDLSAADRARVACGVAHACACLRDAEGVRRWLDRYDAAEPGARNDDWWGRHARELRAQFARDAGERRVETPAGAAPAATSLEGGGFPTADPRDLGVDVDALERHRALCEASGADAEVVVVRGKVVSEWYGERYEEPVHAMSSTKSITSLLVGMLIADRRIDGVEQPIAELLPEWRAGARGGVRLRHLLSHTSGLRKRTDETSVGYVDDKDAYVLGLELDRAPDEAFAYSNEGVQLLSPLLDRAAGEPIQDYARRRLFVPLGLTKTRFKLDRAGHAWTYADLETTPRELARLGWLVLSRGEHDGASIVPAEWIERSIEPSQPFEERCGLLWWRYPELDGFAALGYLDTNVYVFPSREMVVVRTQAKPRADATRTYEPEALELFAQMVAPRSSDGR